MTTFDRALTGYRLEVDERFEGHELDPGRWIPYYLPQWSGRERARASYRLPGHHLELFTAEDQLHVPGEPAGQRGAARTSPPRR